MRIAICPGSYDPVTVGHVDIIRRAAALFDRVIVLVSPNSAKHTFFSCEDRTAMLEAATADIPGVEVQCSNELLAAFAQRVGACALVKGVRNTQDLEYEQQLAQVNGHLLPGLETVFLPADPTIGWLSSTIVREMIRYHQDITKMVPAGALAILSERLEEATR